LDKFFNRHTSFQLEVADQLRNDVKSGALSRREVLKRGSALGLSLGLLGGLFGFDKSVLAQETPKQGGVLKLGIARPRGVVDPLTSRSRSEGFVLKPVLPPLGRLQADGSLAPGLAESWAPNEDATVWTFKFRPTKWISGEAFTAHDIAAALDLLLDPASPSPTVSGYRGILSHGNYEVPDDQTLVFHLDRAYVDFPYIVSYGATAWFPKGYTQGDFAKGTVGGVGPFLLKEYSADRGASYVKNPDYWDAANIHLDGLEIVFFDDDQSMALALQGGQVDALPVLASSAVLAISANPDFEVLSARSSAYNSIRMQVDTEPFTDKRVRQALAYSIDRQAIVNTIYSGAADLGNDHVFAPAFLQSAVVNEAIPQRVRDIAKAKQLLADAGHADGLKLTLTSQQYADIPQYLQLVQSQAKEAGFDITLDLKSQAEYYGADANQPWLSVPFGATDWGERATPGAMITPAYLTGAPFNESKYSSAEFDAAAKAFDGEIDVAKRGQLAIDAAKIMHEDTPTIIGYFAQTRRPVNKKVKGFPAGPASQLDLTGTWLDA